jgi:hypothetical protein
MLEYYLLQKLLACLFGCAAKTAPPQRQSGSLAILWMCGDIEADVKPIILYNPLLIERAI